MADRRQLVEVRDMCCGKKYQSQGADKTNWTKVGVLFVYDNGNMSIKLDYIPVPDATGLNLVAFQKKESSARIPQQAPTQEASVDDLDEIFAS